MMGTKARSFSPLPPDVSLEELVPEDHFYRVLEERLDLSFIRELVAPLYAGGGSGPVVFFKLQLVMFFEGLRQVIHSGQAPSCIARLESDVFVAQVLRSSEDAVRNLPWAATIG
jgi:hypothetical protein